MKLTVKHRRWAVIAVVAAGTAAWGVGLIPAPRAAVQPYSTAYSANGMQANTGISGPTIGPRAGVAVDPYAAPTTAALPAVYGDTGLAAEYAKALGHDSMSEACEAGVTFACGVTKVETSPTVVAYGTAPTARDVYVRAVPMDPNDVAAKFLNESPANITKINVKDASAFLVVDVGTATRGKSASKSGSKSPTPTPSKSGTDQ